MSEVKRSDTAAAIKNRVEYLAAKTREVLKSLSPQEREMLTARAREKLSTGVKYSGFYSRRIFYPVAAHHCGRDTAVRVPNQAGP